MARTYNGEHILDEMSARLVPPDDRYPDCQCAVVLTEEHLYVLEDCFDGTYERHITIPTGDILDIVQEGVQPESGKRGKADNDGLRAAGNVAAMFLGLLGGLLVFPTGGGKGRPIQYLRVRYRDEAGVERRLYCKECAGSIKGMSKALTKYRTRRG